MLNSTFLTFNFGLSVLIHVLCSCMELNKHLTDELVHFNVLCNCHNAFDFFIQKTILSIDIRCYWKKFVLTL